MCKVKRARVQGISLALIYRMMIMVPPAERLTAPETSIEIDLRLVPVTVGVPVTPAAH